MVTRLHERTTVLSLGIFSQLLGFMVGPMLQILISTLENHSLIIIPSLIEINIYTAAGWIGATLIIFNIILIKPAFFTVSFFQQKIY